jgi:hypothetical protein
MKDGQLTIEGIQKMIGRITLDHQIQVDALVQKNQELQARIAQLESAQESKPKEVKKAN